MRWATAALSMPSTRLVSRLWARSDMPSAAATRISGWRNSRKSNETPGWASLPSVPFIRAVMWLCPITRTLLMAYSRPALVLRSQMLPPVFFSIAG